MLNLMSLPFVVAEIWMFTETDGQTDRHIDRQTD